MEKTRIGLFDQIILTLVHGLSKWNFQFPNGIEYLSAHHTFILTNKETAYVALRLYFMALDEFPDNTRDMIMALEKAQIEDELVKSQPSRDWTQVWLENKSDHEILVLYSVCQNKDCLARCRPVLVPYRLYRQKLVTAAKIIDYNDGFPPMHCIVHDCHICHQKTACHVLNSFVNVGRCIDKSQQTNI